MIKEQCFGGVFCHKKIRIRWHLYSESKGKRNAVKVT